MTPPDKRFKPTSKRFQYIDHSLGYKFKTSISYELGKINGRKAVRFYINNQVESTRFISKRINEHNFKLYKVGGQTLHSVRRQREKCLEFIVRDLFKTYGFEVSLKSELGNYYPDMLIKNDTVQIYFELKAYHESYLCGDTEISQVMKYWKEARILSLPSKVGLITSSSLLPSNESFLCNQSSDPVDYVASYYKKLIIPRSQLRSLDDFSRRDIYNHAAKKFKRNYKDGFPQVKAVYLTKNHLKHFPSCLSSIESYDMLLIDSAILSSLLKKEKLFTQASKLKSLREKAQERLIINGKILKS